MRVGLREANQRFSRIVKTVKSGGSVILTDRGRPIAMMRPLRDGRRADSVLLRLALAGLVRPATKTGPMARFRPRRLKGKPMSATIREERDLR